MENTHPQFEIDILLLLKKLWSKKFFVTLIALLFGTGALVYSLFFVKPLYTSTTRIYVVNQNSNSSGISAQDFQVGDYLVKDYREIILSKDVMEETAARAAQDGLTVSGHSVYPSNLNVSTPASTRVISISISDHDPEIASYLANTVREVAILKIKEITKVEDVTTLEVAEPATEPSSPNIKRNVVIGVLSGAFLAVVLVFAVEILDDRVKRPEDIEEVLGMTLLGLIPNAEQLD